MKNTSYLDMIAGRKPDHIPVWFMRQAGRSQAKYREIKKKYTLFEITHQPELCAYITTLPVEEYGVDAAILYKDIMTPLPPMGVDVEIKAGVGPVMKHPIRTMADVKRIQPLAMESALPYILDTIRLATSQMLDVPLIGFCGAPFTLASYLIEGGPSKSYIKTRRMMVAQPGVWQALMEKLTAMSITYLSAQLGAGASAVQIFDSWVGAVSAKEYEIAIFPYMKRIVEGVKQTHPLAPITLFGVGTKHLLPLWKALPVDVVGLDWRSPVNEAHQLGIKQTLQGNLDPAYVYADWSILQAEIDGIIEAGQAHGSFIFNLGHGIQPDMNPDTLKRMVTYIHENF